MGYNKGIQLHPAVSVLTVKPKAQRFFLECLAGLWDVPSQLYSSLIGWADLLRYLIGWESCLLQPIRMQQNWCLELVKPHAHTQHLKLKLNSRHYSAVTLEITKLTLSKRIVERLHEVPKPLLVCPEHSSTINELMASVQRRYWVVASIQLPQLLSRCTFWTPFFIHSINTGC